MELQLLFYSSLLSFSPLLCVFVSLVLFLYWGVSLVVITINRGQQSLSNRTDFIYPWHQNDHSVFISLKLIKEQNKLWYAYIQLLSKCERLQKIVLEFNIFIVFGKDWSWGFDFSLYTFYTTCSIWTQK